MRVGITGHRGLPERSAALVRSELRAIVGDYRAAELTGVSCVADGPDAWFAQAVLDHGGRLEVVIPAEDYRGVLPRWHDAVYDSLVGRASEVHATGFSESDDPAYMAASEILVGLVDEVIAVWDGRPARGYGGTADVVRYAESVGVAVRIVWPEGATRD
ncbi:hypothetical protein [Actinacidiphila yeochonensis]|uniref:hypothetical protein n=1 Tax=Actinacidiphila yeochonensis TaxID=89050 RepID=UPI0005669248|nr:hypothetical protein [Actinacidiphila yeochonensis]